MDMNDEPLKKKLDILWDKVQEKMDSSEPSASIGGRDFDSAFELMQKEIQRDEIRNLEERFNKEKAYWENLVAAKEKIISDLQKQVHDEQTRGQSLKGRIEELQDNLNQVVQQSFGSLDMQKKTYSLRIEQLDKELEENRKEIRALKDELQEEKRIQEQLREEWQGKERLLLESKDKREAEIVQIEQDLYHKRESELNEIAQLEANIRNLQEQLSETKTLHEVENSKNESAVREREGEIQKIKEGLETANHLLEQEREEKRLSALERERQAIQQEEDRKRIIEHAAGQENKIKELQNSLEKMIKEKVGKDEDFAKREDDLEQRIKSQQTKEEDLLKRREEWIESIKGQNGQQLTVSNKIVDLIAKVEWEMPMEAVRSGLRTSLQQPPPLPENFRQQKMGWLHRFFSWSEKRIGLGLMIFALLMALSFWVVQLQSKKRAEADRWIKAGYEELAKGDLFRSLENMEKAYLLAPKNPMTQDSLKMVLKMLALREMKESRFKQALFYCEQLIKVSGAPQEVERLRNEIGEAEQKLIQSQAEEARKEAARSVSQVQSEKIIPPQTPGKKMKLEFEVEEDGSVVY